MRILTAALQVTLLFGLVACNSSDRERAREEARREAQKAAEEAKKAAHELKDEAKDLKRHVNDGAARPSNGSASEEMAHAGDHAKDAAARAQVHLDHAALVTRVKAKLASDAGLATLKNVDVAANGSVVTLSGTVSNEYQKRAAVIAASQVEGVTNVEDHIVVQK